MCFGSSHDVSEQQPPRPRPLRNLNISQPQGGLQMVPEPQRDHHGIPVTYGHHDLNRNNLIKAFQNVALYLRQRNANVTIIAVGGAVNTVLLRSRATTHDVDFFSRTIKAQDVQLVREASLYAAAQSSIPLGGGWLNNATDLYVSQDVAARLVPAAVAQNAVVFEEPGLKVLAAPWDFAMCGKLDRLSGDPAQVRPYDATDGAVYLHHHFRSHGGQPVSRAQVEAWARDYAKRSSPGAIRAVADEFRRMYGQLGITA